MERKTIEIDGVFDIETENWSTFVCGGLLTRKGYCLFWWENEEEMIDALLEIAGSIWSFNGGKFDILWFLHRLLARKRSARYQLRIGLAGQRVARLQIGDLVLRDAAALIPAMSLDRASEIGKIRKSKTDLPCRCEANRHCGGYCSIRRRMEKHLRPKLAKYVEQDCRATLSMLDELATFANVNDLDLRGTIGNSAWHCAARQASLPKASWEAGEYAFARRAYFGGRCQVFQPQVPSGFRYDVVSAYPAALSRLSLPTGERRMVDGAESRRAFDTGKEGVWKAIVEISRQHIPPLPVRLRDRIAYPYGRVTGTWTGLELRYAQTCGVQIHHLGRALVWSDHDPVLAPFCNRVWELRNLVGPKSALGTWIKLYANSLTGKLAQNPDTEEVLIDPKTIPICKANFPCLGGMLHTQNSPCCRHRHNRCSCVAPRCIDTQAMRVWSTSKWRVPDCGYVHWSAYLTAWARIELHKQLVDDGQEGRTACYCDTDSVISSRPRTNRLGSALGEWKAEGSFWNFCAVAPKTYSLEDTATGEFIGRSKGIREPARNWSKMVSGESVRVDRGVESFKTAAKQSGNFFRRKSLSRRVLADGLHFGDRLLGSDGLTYPQDVRELELAREE